MHYSILSITIVFITSRCSVNVHCKRC